MAVDLALILIPFFKNTQNDITTRLQQSKVESLEIVSLARAMNIEVRDHTVVNIANVRPATFFGTGKLDSIANIVKKLDINLLIVDHQLTPVQQSNLEKLFKVKVIDRTALILEIFAKRARTKEGTLQVELARLSYQKSRLVRSWTHLERQRGGTGFMGGPGEKQIESDRRHIQQKINAIQKQLEAVVKTRKLHREKRKKVPYPIVSLVGYTNAGKSTLFNFLTNAGVVAQDMLFATLDPTLREVILPSGNSIILSDTVGFISDLPIMLVSAFRATLEEVCEADLILHVTDISNSYHTIHKAEVLKNLKILGIDVDGGDKVIEVWNKIDALDEVHRKEYNVNKSSYHNNIFAISSTTGENINELLSYIDELLFGTGDYYSIELQSNELHKLKYIYKYGRDLDIKGLEAGGVILRGKFAEASIKRLLDTVVFKTPPFIS